MTEPQAYRLTGKAALREAIDRLREKADRYEAFLNTIPDNLSQQEDDGLWLMAIDIKR